MAPESPSAALSSPLLRGLDPDAARELLSQAQSRRLRAGEALFRQGDPVEALFVVESGRLKLSQLTADGEEIVVRTVGRGAIVAGVALLEKRTLPVSATAISDCVVLAWPRGPIGAFATRYPVVRSNVLATIADRMQESLTRIRQLSTASAAQRVAGALVKLARDAGRPVGRGIAIDQPLGRQDLAELSGASMFTTSRLLAGWARDGILEVGRQRVVVLSLDRLERLAGDEVSG